jgi:hypothetical protein
LKGLKIAPFYGCHILRPADIVRFDDPWNPHSLEDLISALGAEPIKFKGRIECCGFPLLFIKESTANKMAGSLLAEALDGGADLIVTPLPPLPYIARHLPVKGCKGSKKENQYSYPTPPATRGPRSWYRCLFTRPLKTHGLCERCPKKDRASLTH